MSASKSVVGLLVFAKTESVYNSGASMVSTDAVQTILDHPVFNIEYVFDGDRKGGNFTGGNLRRISPTGRQTSATVRFESKGSGSAYVAGTTPPNTHPFTLAAGFSASLASGQITYRPVSASVNPNSLALSVYTRGEVWPVSGAYANMKLIGENGGPVIEEYAVQGTLGLPSDITGPPAFVMQGTQVVPPNNNNISLNIGGWTGAVVRSWNYDHGLEISPRQNVNSTSGHAGFATGRRNPTFNVTIEAPALTSFNAYLTQSSATPVTISLVVGSTTGNITEIQFPQAYLETVTQGNDGPVATLDLVFKPATSTPSLNDDVVLIKR